MKTKLLLFPFGGNTIEALDCLGPNYEFLGFIDDAVEKQNGLGYASFEVFSRDALNKHPDAKVLAVPGNAATFRNRAGIIASLNLPEERFVTLIHPAATVSKHAKIGVNTLIMAGTVVTSNAVLGDSVCVLPNSVIHHDATIGDYSLIGSNVTIAGGAKIGKNSYIGSGSQIINKIIVGNGALVGLGTSVIRDVPENATVAGNPGRFLR